MVTHWSMLAIAIAIACGCDDGRPTRVPVSGQVLIDGKPLAYGFIRICPADARPASGNLTEDGRFTLTTFDKDDGVVPGNHPVTVTAGEYISDEITSWHAPEKYAETTTSGLTIDIDGPTDALEINLSWEGDKPYKTREGVRVR